MKTYWHPAVKRADIEYCTPHALRHSAAAIMIDLGANPVTIQQ
jgi:integrase